MLPLPDEMDFKRQLTLPDWIVLVLQNTNSRVLLVANPVLPQDLAEIARTGQRRTDNGEPGNGKTSSFPRRIAGTRRLLFSFSVVGSPLPGCPVL